MKMIPRNQTPTRAAPRGILPYRFHVHIRTETVAFYYWFYVIAGASTTFLFFRSNPARGALLDGLIVLGFFSLAGLLAVTVGRTRRGNLIRTKPAKLILLYLTWAGATLLWTNATSSIIALQYWVLFVLGTLTMGLLMLAGDIERIAHKSLQGIIWGAVALAAVSMFFAGETRAGRLGDYQLLHPNTIGKEMALASLCSIHLAIQSRRRSTHLLWSGITVLLLATLVHTMSKTSIAGFIVAAFVYFIHAQHKLGSKWLVALVVAGFFAFSYPYLSGKLDQYTHDKSVDTISGRTELWERTWEMIQDRPLVGYGFNSFRDYGPQTFHRVRVVHAHNEWLHLWFTVGAVGVFLAIATYISFFRLLLRVMNRKPYGAQVSLGLAILVLVLVRGIAEAEVVGLVFPLNLMLLLSAWISVSARMPAVAAAPGFGPLPVMSATRAWELQK